MANTYVDYTATAAQTDFAFSFDYLEDEHVTVEIDGVVQLTSDYSIVTSPSTKVVLNVGATAGQIVRVRRKSQPDTNLVDFVNGSVLTESELDRAYLHNRYLAEEIAELNDASLQLEQGGTQWDAKSLRIKNVDTPTAGTDATNKTYVDTNDALKVAKAGDSMTGELAMGGNKVTGLGTPTATTDASTKDYVDSKVNQVSSGASSPPTKWVFTGTAGANTTYVVTGAEVNGDTAYDVSIDGAVKEPTTDYTVDPDTDTLTIIPTLSGGEDIVVIERGFGVAVTGTVGSSQIQTGAVTADKISTTDAVFNIQSDGKVGIGRLATDDILEIAFTEDNSAETDYRNVKGIKIWNTSATSGTLSALKFYTLGSAFGIVGERVSGDAMNLHFISESNDGAPNTILTLLDGGQVGIGTKTPSTGIEVVGKQGILIREFQGSLGNQMPLISSSITDRLDQVDWGVGIKAVVEDDVANGFGIAFWTRNAFDGTFSEKVRISKDGKVGILNDNPLYELDVAGDINITGDYKINGASAITVPTGTVSAFAGSAAPTGYLLCDGSAVDRTTYATLFGIISTTYGTGDGSTTFNLPDLRGRVIAGIDSANNVLNDTSSINGTALGNTGGDDVHTLSVSEMPSHSHDLPVDSVAASDQQSLSNTAGSDEGLAGEVSSGLTGGGAAHNNVQPTIILNYIIKI